MPHYYLGKIALETGGAATASTRALAHLAEAIKADAAYAPAHRELGLAYYRKGDRPNAIGSLERYLALVPKRRTPSRSRPPIAELKRFYGGVSRADRAAIAALRRRRVLLRAVPDAQRIRRATTRRRLSIRISRPRPGSGSRRFTPAIELAYDDEGSGCRW